MSLLEELKWRGLLHQVTDEEGLNQRLQEGAIALYCGFDPTADSLHIGSLLPILTLRRFQLDGHRPIALVGGATGLIGDPSGKKQERTLNSQDVVASWSESLKNQLSRFLDFDHPENPAEMANNYDWTQELTVISFLRDIGKHFSVNQMLAKESVSARLETGISFTEFSYMILQSNDFLQLQRTRGCVLQIGGSDQWGNITAGMDLIRRADGNEAFGLTIPLVTKADGTKFGKTESGTIWLDSTKTSPYHFYQFWINVDDRDVVPFLKYFTFLSLEDISSLERSVAENPGAREAQKTLAAELTQLVHGNEALEQALRITETLFQGDIRTLSVSELRDVFQDAPTVDVTMTEPIELLELLIQAGAATSRRQAREDVQNGAITINGVKWSDAAAMIGPEDALHGLFVVRRGKKKYFLAQLA